MSEADPGVALIDAISAVNDAIQDWLNAHGEDAVPKELAQLLADLDWVLNGP